MDPIEIKTRREALGLTQEALADILGIRLNAVARWETGVRKPQNPLDLHLMLKAIEDKFQDLIAQYIEIGESEEDLADSPDVTFIVYGSDAAFAAAEPALAAAGVTAAMHRMAVGQARLELEAGDMNVRIISG